jgi:3-isopropylmalate/(R)-2-methylmalate dehydratase small subunit
MEAFTTFRGVGIPIDIQNCDTDQIIPARFLRRDPTDEGYDRFLFHDLRFAKDGTDKPDFVLNNPAYRDASVVIANINWGCGSSRENAVYVLVANGISSVIAPSFGDIHYNNCMKHGILPVRLQKANCDTLRQQLHDTPGVEIALDLEEQTVTGPDGNIYSFKIDRFDKHRLLNGLDEISMTLGYDADIIAFEHKHRSNFSWFEQ